MSGKRLHPLHSVEFLASMMANTGCYPDQGRCTGRTTIGALETIALAMQQPHRWVYPLDHHGSTEATRNMLRVASDMITKLGLKHFTFRVDAICFGNPNG